MDIKALHQYFLKSSGVCTDTRNITENCLFFALKGENFNGNHFTQEALDKGAYKVVVDEDAFHKSSEETVLVESVLLALQQLAYYHRKFLDLQILALTGSNGKTTSKELINAVLSQKYKTVATKGNLNNHIGVPLTLLEMTKSTEFGIVEMGANHIGEIAMLCEIAQPDYGYITNFGKAHLEGFGSITGVVTGKTELYRFLKKNNKTVFLNADDPKQIEMSQGIKSIQFGPEGKDCNIKLLNSSQQLRLGFKNIEIQSNLVGTYNFPNLAAAIAIGNYFKVSAEEIKAGIESYIPANNRSQLLKKETNTVLLDAYNANPTSMMAALENFKQAKGKNKILFLGDMFELGGESESEHQNIVNFLSKNSIGKVFLVGINFYKTQSEDTNINKFETFEDLKEELSKISIQNSTLLIKASRGMALERILNLL